MSDTVSGGCLLGAIRFEASAKAEFQLLCHCSDCQTVSGAAAYAAYVVPINSLNVIRGEPAHFDVTADSGRINSRHFCPTCGTRVWAVIEEIGMASVNGLALDNRSHFQPGGHSHDQSRAGLVRA